MDMLRTVAIFLAGVVVMGAIHFAGWLDGAPHWWARHPIARSGSHDDRDMPARYGIRAVYRPGGGRDADCPPQYEFHNRSNRLVAFSADGYEQDSHDGSGDWNDAPVSLQPPDQGRSRDGARDGDDPQAYDKGSYGSEEGYDAGYSQDDVVYRGGQQDVCNPGVVQIFVDRKPPPERAAIHRAQKGREQPQNESRPNR